MSRIRTIKPQFWLDEKLGAIPRDARLLYIGLWNLSDDRGVFEYRPARIKAQIFPYDEKLKSSEVAEWLKMLEGTGDVIHFVEGNQEFGYIPTFLKHQIIDRPSERHYSESLPDLNLALVESSANTQRGLSLGNREGGIGNREKEQGIDIGSPPAPVFSLPEYIDISLWTGFLEVRKKKKVPATDHAIKLLVADLIKFHDSGQDANKILEESIKRGWAGIFPLKDGNNGHQPDGINKGHPQAIPGNKPAGAFAQFE